MSTVAFLFSIAYSLFILEKEFFPKIKPKRELVGLELTLSSSPLFHKKMSTNLKCKFDGDSKV